MDEGPLETSIDLVSFDGNPRAALLSLALLVTSWHDTVDRLTYGKYHFELKW